MPKTIGGQKVEYIVLDDASDTTTAVKNTRKLITEDKVDVIIGSTITPNSLAMIDVGGRGADADDLDGRSQPHRRAGRRQAALGLQDAAERHHDGAGDHRPHGRQRRQDGRLHRLRRRLRRGLVPGVQQGGRSKGLTIVANERYNRTDTSVTGQVLKLMAAKPDAVLIAGSGTPAALPQKTLKERGYAGKIYQTHGVANNDFLRVVRQGLRGHLPARRPGAGRRPAAGRPPGEASRRIEYVGQVRSGARQGQRCPPSAATPGTPACCCRPPMPVALKKAQPGTPEFRAALRDALEGVQEVQPARTASSTCRPPTISAWTSARA
jgi:branched-chain amino acid transport system substrate-binding protein